jgi:hypothetical protein
MTPTATPAPVATVPTLTDRCDRCGAAAKLDFQLVSGGQLSLCGHHANRLAGDIVRVARRITIEDGFTWSGAGR